MSGRENLFRKRRILFTIPNFDTAGSGKALLNIASRLDNNLFEPHIACLHSKGDYFSVVESSGIPIHIFKFTSSMTNRIKGLINCWKISKKMKEINPDMIHSFHYAPDYSEALAAWIAGIPWVFTKKNMNWGGKSKNGWRVRSFLAKHIIVQNKDMIGRFYPSSQKITLIPRGVNLQDFKPKKSLDKTRTHLGIPPTSKVIITIANLTPVKGMEYLIEAFNQIKEKYDNARLILIGTPRKEFIEKNHSSDIEITGYLNDEEYQLKLCDADILCMTRIDSGFAKAGFPFKLGEYLATAKPVIATDVTDVSLYLEDKQDVVLAKPSNTQSLVDAMEFLITKPEVRKIIGENGLKQCEKFFNPEINSKMLFDFMKKVNS